MYRVAIVGCGGIFEMHAVSLSLLDQVEIVAVCDIKTERAKEKACKYGCRWYSSYEVMLEQETLDAVHICTPHYLHAPMSLQAIRKGIDVVCEKPMALNLEDAQHVLKEAQENGVKYAVVFQNRHNPGSQLAYDVLAQKEIGDIVSAKISITWDRGMDYYQNSDWKGTLEKEGGGVVIDQAVHSFDLVQWLIPQELNYVSATCCNRLHEGIEVEDEAVGVFYLGEIPVSFYTVNYFSTDTPVEILLHCTKGMLKITGDEATVFYNDGTIRSAQVNSDEYIDFGEGAKEYWGTSHYKLIARYYSTTKNMVWNKEHHQSYLNTQRLIMYIYESSRLGKALCRDGRKRIHDKTWDISMA